MHKIALLSAAAALAASLTNAALADSVTNQDLLKGIQLYNSNQPEQALGWLERAAKSSENGKSLVHFYLGNVYMKLKRPDLAKVEYTLGSTLEPSTKAAALSKEHLEKLEPGHAAVSDKQAAAEKAIADAVNKLPAPQLPPLPSMSSEHPSWFEIQQWTPALRSQYMSQAQDRVPRMEKQLYDAKQLLAKAQDAASTFVPTRRNRTEDDAAFKLRVKACQKRVATMLAPYEEYLSKCEQELKDSKSILDSCRVAFRNVNGYMQVSR